MGTDKNVCPPAHQIAWDGPQQPDSRNLTVQYGRRLMCLLTLMLAAGCGSDQKLLGVRGEVSFDGKAVEKGRIEFLPVDGTAGGIVGGSVTGGRYELPAVGGLLRDGTYLVRITAFRKTGQTTTISKYSSKPMEVEENYIPASYNSQSTLKVRVRDLPDANKVDFRLGKDSVAAPASR
jgi:hypothetical protein